LTKTSAALQQNATLQSGLLDQLNALPAPNVPAASLLDYTNLKDELKDVLQSRLENTLTLEVPGATGSINAYTDLDTKFVDQLKTMASTRNVNFDQTFKS
jgi:hypothetical protein